MISFFFSPNSFEAIGYQPEKYFASEINEDTINHEYEVIPVEDVTKLIV